MKNVMMSLIAATLFVGSYSQACNVVPQGTCYVKETQQYIRGDEFFSAVSARANRTDSCTVGRVKGKESGRMYWNGQRIQKGEGCLSHKEIKEIKADYALIS